MCQETTERLLRMVQKKIFSKKGGKRTRKKRIDTLIKNMIFFT